MNTGFRKLPSRSVLYLGAGLIVVLGAVYIATVHPGRSGRWVEGTSQETRQTGVVPTETLANQITRNREKTAQTAPPGTLSGAELFSFSADGFDRAWDSISADSKDEESRATLLRQVAIRMAILGHSDIAIKAIQRDFGEGETRANLISACFAYAADPSLLGQYYALLDCDSDRSKAASAVFECIASNMASAGVEDVKKYDLAFLGDKSNGVLVEAAEQYFIQLTNDGSQSGEDALNAILAMGFDNGSKLDILARLADDLPFQCWDQSVKLLGEDIPQDDDFRQQIIREMMKKDPGGAMGKVLQAGQPEDLETAIYSWSKLDVSKSQAWLNNQKDNIPPEAFDHAISGLSRSLAEYGKFSEASECLAQIKDPSQKQQIQDAISTIEQKAQHAHANE